MKRAGVVISTVLALMALCMFVAGCGSSVAESDSPQTTTTTAYSDPSLTTSASAVNAALGSADVVILDIRSSAAYTAGHIPGAINVIWQTFATVGTGSPGDPNWGVLKTPAEIGTLLGSLGIDATKEVVVYADAPDGWGEDGRIVWMMRMAGVVNAKMLNGGIKAWQNAGYALSTTTPTPVAVTFSLASLDNTYTTDKAWILSHMNDADVKIIDVRASEEYAGAILYGERRGGHLPGAISLPFNTTLFTNDPTNPGVFKNQDQLEAIFTAAGIKKTDTIVSYCTKGIRSALMTMALRMAGYTKAVNYDASFYDWAGDAAAPVVNHDLVKSGAWLAANIANTNQVIIDTRSPALYAAGHIPGAINLYVSSGGQFDIGGAGIDQTDLKPAADIATILGAAGVSQSAKLIVYGATVDAYAGRMFWLLEYLGATDVHLLDGGYGKWVSDGRAVATAATTLAATTFTPAVTASRLATKADVLANYNNAGYAILDSRNAVDYTTSHIPNAINILIGDFLNADNTVKAYSDLKTFLDGRGITTGKTVITNCYVGYRSSQEYFILRLMGFNVSNYDGSWTEWNADPATPKVP